MFPTNPTIYMYALLITSRFPLFTGKLYQALGIHWASSVPGFLALIFIPCLFLFYTYGDRLRKMTRFGAEAASMAAK